MRKRAPLAAAETTLLHALAKDGCPICHSIARSDEQHFFWFFNENYCEPFTIAALTRSLGFCLLHSEVLARTGAGPSQLTTVYEQLVRRVRATLSSPASGGESARSRALKRDGPCPVCRDRREQEARNAIWLTGIVEGPAAGAYGRPGLVCFPHFQLLVPRLSRAALERLLAVHDSAMAAALGSVSDLSPELDSAPADGRQDLKKALLPNLHLTVGHELDTGAYPRPDEAATRSLRRDPVAELLESCGQQACPVCLEARRAWIEWNRWLDRAAERQERVEDLLPGCPQHVWAIVHRGGGSLATRAARRALELGIGDLRVAAGLLNPPPKKPGRDRSRGLIERAQDAVSGPQRRFRTAREVLGRPVRCAVCERLAIAQDRALALLFALLHDERHRRAVQTGYGLCLKHLVRALELGPPPEIAAALVASEAARLACLQWELEEASRKAAWHFRPEDPGEEQTAWHRALLRFAGSLRATWT